MIRLRDIQNLALVAKKALAIDYIYHESTPREVQAINKNFVLEITNEDGTEELIFDVEWMLLHCPGPEVEQMAVLVAMAKDKKLKKQATIISLEDAKIQDELAKNKADGKTGIILP